MKSLLLLLCLALVSGGVSCRSSARKKDTPQTRETARLGDPTPEAQIGGYYRLKGNMNGFYFNVPQYTDVLPHRFLMRGHIVQLLDPSAGGGWARVKNDDLQTGYVQFENLKIVPYEDRPKPRPRGLDEELDQNMQLE